MMEQVGAIKMFELSVETRALLYTSFYGDGDSKSFLAVKDIYGAEKPVSKFECIGHYRKRIGNRLRKLRKEMKLGGKGRLTTTKIDTLQNYFDIALRQNVGDLKAMTNGIIASMYHVAGYYDKCPKYPETWCQFQKDKLEGTSLYKLKGELPMDIRKAILPTYMDLCKQEMLIKCLHGKTQNSNETFNGMLWNRVPKSYHVGLNILSVGVYDAIAHFNYGEKATLDVLDYINVEPGIFTKTMCNAINKERKRSAAYRASETVKKRRKILRHKLKRQQGKVIDQEQA